MIAITSPLREPGALATGAGDIGSANGDGPAWFVWLIEGGLGETGGVGGVGAGGA